MTMPVVGQRVAPDAAIAIAPNAEQVGPSAAPNGADGTAVTPFNAVLSLLLEHAGMAAPAARSAGATDATEATDAPTTADDEGVDAEGSVADSAVPAVAVQHHAAIVANASNASNTEAAAPATLSTDATVAVDVKTVRRDLDLLAPEFRDRLERVIDRMESEFGYKVEVTETYRPQARQDALYAQGRTEPGQVVTWTRASNHTTGRAADLVIDGTYDDPVPYERLMRIAREEGLRTLGGRDPGHVELSSSERAAPIIARSAPSVASLTSIVPTAPELESARTATPVAEPQRVATVARVAQVANVAQVAQVAVVGAQVAPTVHAPAVRARDTAAPALRGAALRRSNGVTAAEPASTSPLLPTSPLLGRELGSEMSGGTGDDRGTSGAPNEDRRTKSRIDPATAQESAVEIMRQSRDELVRAVAGNDPAATGTSSLSSSDGTASIAHADMSERIARLLKVQDAAADRPLSQMMLRLERPDGGEDRLRVDLRGNSVNATLDVGDQGVADRMGANVKELQQALERHGFAADSITVRTTARAQESAALTRAAGASLESDLQRSVGTPSNTSSNTSSRDRGARHDEQRPSPDSHRQRSRREQKGDR